MALTMASEIGNGVPDAQTRAPAGIPPHVQLIQMGVAIWRARAVYAAAELGIADLLAEGPREIEEIARQTGTHVHHRMDQLITQLLDYSRTRRAGMVPATVDLESLVQEVREELAPDCGDRHIEWCIHALPQVVGDRTLLRPMLINLVGNAIKYTRPRDTAVIEIGCLRAAAKQGALVTLYVRDNGVGFNPRFTHKLFGEFQRLHDAAEFEGSGIGLVSVRRIIERHGGKVWAEGVPDAGATFYFSLPAVDAGEQE